MSKVDPTLRRMQTGVYATNWAPPGGRGSTLVAGRWTDLSDYDRHSIPDEVVYGCAICHQAVTRYGATFFIRYAGNPYLVVVTCPKQLCRETVAAEFGMAPNGPQTKD